MITREVRRIEQRGIVLISCMLLLLVVTIIALSMYRSFGIQEKVAGNMREKQRALQSAMTAQQYAEWWLSYSGNAALNTPVTCNSLLNANLNQVQICANALPTYVTNNDVTQVPWQIGSANVGVTLLPTNMVVSTNPSTGTAANPTFYSNPTFYISDMGPSGDPTVPGEIYQIDAFGYGGNANTVAVVESTYAVYTTSSNRTL